MENKKIVLDLLKALAHIQVGFSDLDKVLPEMTDEEVKEVVKVFEDEICSLDSLDDHYGSEFAVQHMHSKIDEIKVRVMKGA